MAMVQMFINVKYEHVESTSQSFANQELMAHRQPWHVLANRQVKNLLEYVMSTGLASFSTPQLKVSDVWPDLCCFTRATRKWNEKHCVLLSIHRALHICQLWALAWALAKLQSKAQEATRMSTHLVKVVKFHI